MRPISLRLRGAIGIRDGLGLDEIEITFATLSPGLIAIVGKNGSGKTTILDNLHPYLELPSREGSLADHFFLRDSVRELRFELDQVRYRSEILVDARTGRVEAYLFRQSEPLNDGRVLSYKAAIEGLLGSPDVFFNSVFVAQGAPGVTALTSSKRKELFFDLLGLQIYDRYMQYAKSRGEELERSFLAKKTLREEIEKEASEKIPVQESRDRALVALEEVRHQICDKEAERSASEALLEESRSKAESLVRIKKERDALAEDIGILAERLTATEQDHEADAKKLAAEVKQIEKETIRTNSILIHQAEIAAKVDQLRALRHEHDALCERDTAARDIAQSQSEAFLAHERALNEYERDLTKLRHREERIIADENRFYEMLAKEETDLRRQLEDVQRTAELVNQVPCRSIEDLPGQCPLLRDALEADKRASELMKRLMVFGRATPPQSPASEALRAELQDIAECKAELERNMPQAFDDESFEARTNAVGYDASRHQDVREQIKQLEKEKWEHLAEELLVAQSVLSEKKAASDILQSHMARLKAQRDATVGQLSAEIALKRERLNDLSPLSPPESNEGGLLWRRSEIISELESLRKRELTLHAQAESARVLIERIEKRAQEGMILDQEIAVIAAQAEHWRILQRACSRDGIPALELDAAGPGISGIANELLASTFGARFQIAFETTKLSKDRKKQLETFNIIVYGAAGQKRIEDLSGGERVWIERAISEAIAIYMSEHSGCKLETTFQDESDGPLDPENKQNYFSLLGESFRLGKRHFTFIITQTPEIWEQIEQRIHLKPDVGVELVY